MSSMIVALFLAGCAPTPAGVKFEGENVTVHTMDPIAVNKATVVDAEGKALATQPAVKWTVEPDSVAKLDGDKVTPIAAGEATVKACVDAICGQYMVKVSPPDDIEVAGGEGVAWTVGATAQLTAKVSAGGEELKDQKITWSSDNPAVATVDETGKVTVTGIGAAVVTATSGALNATFSVAAVDPLAATAPATN